MADQKHKLTKSKPYAIINTHPLSGSGEHWVGLAKSTSKIDAYDSFGRNVKNIVQIYKGNNKVVNSDRSAEQNILEENCGQRSLAWLYIYDRLGRDSALLI